MPDVLAITIELPDGKYASVNSLGKDGFRGGRKSDAYKFIFNAVKEAAEKEIERIGWVSTPCEHDVSLFRFMPIHWPADSSNAGKAENDAMTAAGVWPDDRYGNPFRSILRYHHEGPHRIAIVVVKLYEPANVFALDAAPKPKRAPKIKVHEPRPVVAKPVAAKPGYRTGDPIPNGFADVNGQLVPRDKALSMIRGK